MRRTVLGLLVLAVCVAGAAATAVALRDDAAGNAGNAGTLGTPPGNGASTAEVQQAPRGVREYWTDRRMDEAEPAPMPQDC